MSLVSRLNNMLPSTQFSPNVAYAGTSTTDFLSVGNELIIYPEDGGERYVQFGYKKNDAVYAIVSKNAEKCSQVRLYHMQVKRDEVKTASEYRQLTKLGGMNDKVIKEMARMRKAMAETAVVDSPLQKLLNRPTRYQTQADWIENLVGLRELHGEGNLWLNTGTNSKLPVEMLTIPKSQLFLVGDGKDPWKILGYDFQMTGNLYRIEPDRVVMWKYFNPTQVNSLSLEHLRGLAPLQAGMVLVQSMNEADVRLATSNKNGGASGMAFKETITEPSVDQKTDMRRQFNNAVNSNEMANKIAIMAGKWGYFNFAQSVNDQQLIEQYKMGFIRLCRVFKTPSGIFDEGRSTYDNQKQFTRNWIYSKISPLIYSLCGVLNESLLSRFNLDPERNIIDADVSTLPEMSSDLAEQVDAVKEAWWLTGNEKRTATGNEESPDPNMNRVYIPSSYTTLDELNAPIAGSLDGELNALNG